jgi:hypothetical protein
MTRHGRETRPLTTAIRAMTTPVSLTVAITGVRPFGSFLSGENNTNGG